jgi:hypothetical protein
MLVHNKYSRRRSLSENRGATKNVTRGDAFSVSPLSHGGLDMKSLKHLTRILLSLTVLAVGFGSGNYFSQSPAHPSQEQTAKEADAALAVVQNYVSLSSAGKFDELAELTTAAPKRFRKENKVDASKYPPGTVLVSPRPDASKKYDLNELRRGFPQVIHDTGHRIMIVAGTSVKDDLAKVTVHLGNDAQYQALPRVFLLTRDAAGSNWKIFEVSTPAGAEDYK